MIVGGAVHVIDSSISGGGLAPLAHAWGTAAASDQAELLRVGDALLYALNGTWWSVHSYFHGLPFVLAGLAVVASRGYPTWLGWIGVAGGTASLAAGVLQFLRRHARHRAAGHRASSAREPLDGRDRSPDVAEGSAPSRGKG